MLYVYTLGILGALDFVWLSATASLYRDYLAHLFAPAFSFLPALVFYPLYAAGIVFFVLIPALTARSRVLTVFLRGAFLGLLAYGAYDLTNQATLTNWPLLITVIDMAWGAFVTGASAALAYLAYTRFNHRI